MVRLRKRGSALRFIATVMKTRGHNISHVAVKDILERAMREDVVESWLGKSGQRAKWSFCLTAVRMAAEQEKR
jgi:hypothetical protein